MSKKNGKSRKNENLYKLALATAILQLIAVIIEIIIKLIE